MFAAVDLGSNSFRLHIGRYEHGQMRIVQSVREPNRLAAGLDKNGFITATAMQVGVEALERLRAAIEAYPVTAMRVVATNTLRVAHNAQTFLEKAEAALGHPIEIISGEEEGRLIYMGVAHMLGTTDERRLVIDIGGGSTELISGKGYKIDRAESFGIGTVNQSQQSFADGRLHAKGFQKAILAARSRFEPARPFYRKSGWKAVYGSSGTIRAIAELIAENRIGDGKLTQENLELLREKLLTFEKIERISLPGIRAHRSASVVSGVSILLGLMGDLNIRMIEPVASGLRMGILWDLHRQTIHQDRRDEGVQNCLQRYRVNAARAAEVAEVALDLFHKLSPTAALDERYVYWSGLLHEVGMYVSPTNYHKHGAYLIEHADLPGFTQREQKQMGDLVLGQKGNLLKIREKLLHEDFMKAVLALRLAVLLVQARVGESRKQIGLKMKKRIELTVPEVWHQSYPTLFYWLEREAEIWQALEISFVVRMQ